MKISLDYEGTYLQHKEYFDILAHSLQKAGHEVGIITGLREKEYGYDGSFKDNKKAMLESLGFTPSFCYVWGENETIGNGPEWKVKKIIQEGVSVHYDDDATELKKYTDRWIIKVMNNAEISKF